MAKQPTTEIEVESRRELLDAARNARASVLEGRSAASDLLARDDSPEAKAKAKALRWNATHLERYIDRVLTWCGYGDEDELAELVES